MDTKPTWYIIASGPSLTKADVESIKGQKVIAINDNYIMAPWSGILYACDGTWWDWHSERAELKAFKGRKITQDKEASERYNLEYIESVDAPGLSRDPKYVNKGSNSGIQAINLACHLGAHRIVLLGYDMQHDGVKSHWFGEHPNTVKPPVHRWLRHYEFVARDAEKMGIEIINATKETALTCFQRKPLSSLLPVQV